MPCREHVVDMSCLQQQRGHLSDYRATSMKVLNLYAGVGGNRHLWPVEWVVTAVEHDRTIAAVYSRLHPRDTIVVGDAHGYLLAHWREFDMVWSSPPCPTHSVMMKATRHAVQTYPDMRLYQEIIFLKHFFHGKWVVENVRPYYEPLLAPDLSIGRHRFWTNLSPGPMEEIPHFTNRGRGIINMSSLANKDKIIEWLGMPPIPERVYVGNNHCPCQFVRNCVHPRIGIHVVRELLPDYM